MKVLIQDIETGETIATFEDITAIVESAISGCACLISKSKNFIFSLQPGEMMVVDRSEDEE